MAILLVNGICLLFCFFVIYFKIFSISAFTLRDVHFYLIFSSFEEREAAIELAGMSADYDQEVIIGILISVMEI